MVADPPTLQGVTVLFLIPTLAFVGKVAIGTIVGKAAYEVGSALSGAEKAKTRRQLGHVAEVVSESFPIVGGALKELKMAAAVRAAAITDDGKVAAVRGYLAGKRLAKGTSAPKGAEDLRQFYTVLSEDGTVSIDLSVDEIVELQGLRSLGSELLAKASTLLGSLGGLDPAPKPTSAPKAKGG